MDNINPEVRETNYGYFELKNKPGKDELTEYYRNKYYQESNGSYQNLYSAEEIKFENNKIEQKYSLVQNLLPQNKKLKLLDIGCGEGFCLSYFYKKDWEILGLDFSVHGLATHNPHIEKYVISGDIYDNLKILEEKKSKFDLIWLDNVLEHVLDPLQLLVDCYNLTSENGLLIIEVPNDFSKLQLELKEQKFIDRDFWVVSPDHISYFNKEGLINICKKADWNVEKIIADFPIDFNLFNPNANYIVDKKTGKGAHLQRIKIGNLMHQISVAKANKFYEALADLGLGRQIIAVFKK